MELEKKAVDIAPNLFSELASQRPMTEALSVEVHSPYPFFTRVLSIPRSPVVLCMYHVHWCTAVDVQQGEYPRALSDWSA